MSCQSGCFEAKIQSCNDIVVRGNFPPNIPLYWIVQRPGYPKLYQVKTFSENNGDLIISWDELPTGFFVTGRQMKIEIRNGNDYSQKIAMIFDGVQYACIIAEMMSIDTKVGDDSPVNVITGLDTTIPSGPGTNYLIPILRADFANATDYINNGLVGHDLEIFWNDVPRYLDADEWQHITNINGDPTKNGIRILVSGFDATDPGNTYSFKIYIVN